VIDGADEVQVTLDDNREFAGRVLDLILQRMLLCLNNGSGCLF
jgi:hypothetical protein